MTMAPISMESSSDKARVTDDHRHSSKEDLRTAADEERQQRLGVQQKQKQQQQEQETDQPQEKQQQQDVQCLQDQHQKEGLRPPDGGWGWMITVGAFLNALTIPMLSPSFGILFSPQLLEWRVSSTTVAVIYSAYMVVWKLTGVIVGSLAREFGFRKVAMTGSLLNASCLTFSAFATSPVLLFVFFSLGCGLGSGLTCVGFLNIAQYFDKHRGLANTCMTAGIGLGNFMGPLLIEHLQDEYGFQGATMILGAILLHGFVGTTLYQPVQWHMKYPKHERDSPNNENISLILPQEENSEITKCDSSIVSVLQQEDCMRSGVEGRTHLHEGSRRWHGSQCSLTSIASSKNSYTIICDRDIASMDSVGSLTTLRIENLSKNNVKTTSLPQEENNEDVTETNFKTSSPKKRSQNCFYKLFSTILRVLRATVKDITILRHPPSLIIAVGSMLIIGGEANFNVLVPFTIQAAGHSLQTAAWCLSVAGICNFFTRLTVSFLSDYSWFNMRLCYVIGLATMSTAIIVFTLQEEVVWLTGVTSVWGIAAGSFHGLSNLLMVRIVGVSNTTAMFGARNFMMAFGFFTIGPLIGVVRDASGSYVVALWVLSAMILTSCILWLLMPAAQAYDQRLRKEIDEKAAASLV
ncbi:monocarboxylate transporter 14-like isoform X1 [Cherax quadricarinatus]|uniref:monocarboxylate transporter 14-like isoform X1 n=1 Tax=Cherax quadricarinatus TaxID=27406 RepID=UPI00387EA3C4